MSSTHRGRFVMYFDEIDQTHLGAVGGKGVNLGELTRLEGVHVPGGFCLTTEAFDHVIGDPAIDEHIDHLSRVAPDDLESLAAISGEVRRLVEALAIPDEVRSLIAEGLTRLGDGNAYAVRSSSTAEDRPTASFAGQHDSYLNVVGIAEILDHVGKCWASAFTERAVAYRQRMDIDQHEVGMAVVIQQMVFPHASGVMFTADPVSSDRTIVAVESCVGLGEGLVSGLVSPDAFEVRAGAIIDRTIARKDLAVRPQPGGGTRAEKLDPDQRSRPVLTDRQVVQLAALGRRIEAHFGTPQDIEWCLADGEFQIVQSRPITTLYPIPPSDDDANRVYISVGHNQMMTDAIRPLGLSLWQMTTPAPMAEAGGRLFVDVTARLAAPSSRADFLELSGKTDPLVREALEVVVDRGDFIATLPEDAPAPPPAVGATTLLDADPAIVTELIARSEESIGACRQDIRGLSGTELLDFIVSDMQELRSLLSDPRSRQVFMTAIEATWWINQHILDWLGEPNVADAITRSVPNNITSEMGLALLDLADAIRPHPEVVAFLRRVESEEFLDQLSVLDGGSEVQSAFEVYLRKYGMRCAGEIDITGPRWSEQPTALLPLILSHVDTMSAGESVRRFEGGKREASAKESEVLERLSALPGGLEKAAQTKEMIDRVRTFIGYREYPKYAMVSRYFIYKQALMIEAERLVEEGALSEKEDIFYLRFDELYDLFGAGQVDRQLIVRRRDAFHSYQRLTPPRVLTSDGEAIVGALRRDDLPDGALPGVAVSSGTVEGRARVVSNIAGADLEPGDILVTTYTDPSWTTAFVSIAGLITEVGGPMTHGAVIARELGVPAVVGVAGATRRIHDGQRIRLHGTDGYVELL